MENLPSCCVITKALLDQTLATPSTQGKRMLEPLKAFSAENKIPLNILEDREVANEAEVHMHEADLWYCLEGEVRFTYGGELVDPWTKKLADGTEDPRELKAKEIKGGSQTVLRPGDWLWIPAGQPHQHSAEGIARLVIIKVPVKTV
ncbi:MAG: hypothetical protein WC892_02935 [Patescibacteria group bacterium]